MKKILWLSRHEMSPSQYDDLKRIYGEVEIKKVDITVNNANQIVESGKDCDVFAVVLPIQLQQQLLKITDKPVISCKNNRIPTGNLTSTGDVEYLFEFDHWFIIKEVKIITEKL